MNETEALSIARAKVAARAGFWMSAAALVAVCVIGYQTSKACGSIRSEVAGVSDRVVDVELDVEVEAALDRLHRKSMWDDLDSMRDAVADAQKAVELPGCSRLARGDVVLTIGPSGLPQTPSPSPSPTLHGCGVMGCTVNHFGSVDSSGSTTVEGTIWYDQTASSLKWSNGTSWTTLNACPANAVCVKAAGFVAY